MIEIQTPVGLPCDCCDCGGDHHEKGKRCEELITGHIEMDKPESQRRCPKCKLAAAKIVELYSSSEPDHPEPSNFALPC